MNDSNVRRAQIVFLIILMVSAGQVIWWLIDQSLYAQAVHDRWQELYKADVVAASALIDHGARAESIEDLFPHLEVSLEGVEVAPAALEKLEQERRSHVNQYAWEGVFFLAVICLGMVVIVRAVRRDAQLRRWQTNFLAAVSHELKSPIASLQLAMETLEMRGGDAERRGQLLQRMLSDVDRLAATVAKVIDTMLGWYDWDINLAQLNLLDSHDTARALWVLSEDAIALKMCVLVMMTLPGAPCIYYGDEIGLSAGDDPDCREAFPWEDESAWDKDLLDFYTATTRLRLGHEALRIGQFETIYAEGMVWVYQREMDGEKAIVALNSDSEAQQIQIPYPSSSGDNLSVAFTMDAGIKLERSDDVLKLSLPSRSGHVLIG